MAIFLLQDLVEKDKDITMLVCSLGFEYKYLNINKEMDLEDLRSGWIL